MQMTVDKNCVIKQKLFDHQCQASYSRTGSTCRHNQHELNDDDYLELFKKTSLGGSARFIQIEGEGARMKSVKSTGWQPGNDADSQIAGQ